MKNRTSINHFTGKEQQSILRFKNIITKSYNPLIIYLLDCSSMNKLTRNCFKIPKNDNNWNLSCTLLLVLPEGVNFTEDMDLDLQNKCNDYECFHVIAHPYDFVIKELEEYSLFFNWVLNYAICLFERDNSCSKLPKPIPSLKQYEDQVKQFWSQNPNYEKYLETKLSKVEPKKLPIKVNHQHVELALSLIEIIKRIQLDNSINQR